MTVPKSKRRETNPFAIYKQNGKVPTIYAANEGTYAVKVEF